MMELELSIRSRLYDQTTEIGSLDYQSMKEGIEYATSKEIEFKSKNRVF